MVVTQATRIIAALLGVSVVIAANMVQGVVLDWTRSVRNNGYDYDGGVAADGLGNLYFAGASEVLDDIGIPSYSETFLKKFNAAGDLKWTKTFPGEFAPGITDVAADASGSSYIADSVWNPSTSSSDARIRKFDAGSNPQWTWQSQIAGSDGVGAISADGLGNIYLSGAVDARRSFVTKINAAGDSEWTKELTDSAAVDAFASSISADGLGNIYIAGRTAVSLDGQNHAGGTDAFVRKYDAAGNVIWTRLWGTDSSDLSSGLAVDTLGNIFIVGQTHVNKFIGKFDSAGVLKWIRTIPESEQVYPSGLEVDGTGNAYFAATYYEGRDDLETYGMVMMRKYNSMGNLVWDLRLDSPGYDGGGAVAFDGHVAC